MTSKIYPAKAILVFCILSFLCNTEIKAQSPGYTIESFQDTYTELESYESIALITGFDPLWSFEFQLDFPFPFYDSIYTRLFFDRSGWGSFTEDQDLSLFLMQYDGWTYDPWMGSKDIDSDARFSHVTIGELQALVIQFTKARIFADPFEDSLDTYLNFQVWLIENGVIEVRFGDIHMDGNPIYKAGKGVYCHTTDEGIDTTDICGPLMSIANPFDESDAIGLHGSYDDYEITGSLYSRLTVLPPFGWVIRFKPITVSTSSPVKGISQLLINPNPASDNIYLSHKIGDISIFDASGRRVIRKYIDDGSLDISCLPIGIYTIQFISDDSLLMGKFARV